LLPLNNKNIISYKEAFIDEDSKALCIVMEYADDGDLFQKIINHQKQMTTFHEDFIWKIFIIVVRGLKALHDLDIMHRDLKSANVFLNKDGSGKLGDMNVSKVAEKGLSYTQTGTPYYASPEVWKDEAYDAKSDIWSLGWVLYEMISLKPPFRAENMQGLYKKVLRGAYPKISTKFSSDIQRVVRMLLQVNPKKRPTWSEILSHPIVKEKTKDIFNEKDTEDKSDCDSMKNSLLKTIYFPKNGQDILSLTDKLPKPSYETLLELSIEKNKSSYRSVSKSPDLRISKETPSDYNSYRIRKKKTRQPSQISKLSKKSKENNSEGSLPSLNRRAGTIPAEIRAEEGTRLPRMKNLSMSPNKMSSVEKIANRIQMEKGNMPAIRKRRVSEEGKYLENNLKEILKNTKFLWNEFIVWKL
jgi:NIMA (never in mitosis gene a)-related kinase 1/4/5